MSLRARIEADLKEAMRAKDELARDTLRMALADLKNKRIELGRDLDLETELGVLRRGVKTRQESVEQFAQGGREDLATKERAEIAVLERYLPRSLSEDETRTIVRTLAAELGLRSKQDIGALMRAVMSRHKGEIDGKLVQKLAGEILA
jgi:uncharacterized protein YqeY